MSETYSIKAPLESALEEADKPAATPEESASSVKEVDFKKDPVGFVKTRGLDFLEKASVNPKQAFTDEPVVGGVVGVVFATLVGMIGVCESSILFSAFSPNY